MELGGTDRQEVIYSQTDPCSTEYLGELYLEAGELEKAQERLRELVAACPSGCEERDELAEAIAAYRQAHGL